MHFPLKAHSYKCYIQLPLVYEATPVSVKHVENLLYLCSLCTIQGYLVPCGMGMRWSWWSKIWFEVKAVQYLTYYQSPVKSNLRNSVRIIKLNHQPSESASVYIGKDNLGLKQFFLQLPRCTLSHIGFSCLLNSTFDREEFKFF